MAVLSSSRQRFSGRLTDCSWAPSSYWVCNLVCGEFATNMPARPTQEKATQSSVTIIQEEQLDLIFFHECSRADLREKIILRHDALHFRYNMGAKNKNRGEDHVRLQAHRNSNQRRHL